MSCLGTRVLKSMMGRIESMGYAREPKGLGSGPCFPVSAPLLCSPQTHIDSLGLVTTLTSLLAAMVLGLDAMGVQRRSRTVPDLGIPREVFAI